MNIDMILDLIRFAVGVSILSYASYADLKSRMVSNIAWISMGMMGAIIIAISRNFELSMLISILLMTTIAFLLNRSKIFGEADPTALIAISIIVPSWPNFDSMPFHHSVMFFPLVIFMNTILLFLAFPIYFCFYNLIKRDFELPQCFFGYKMNARKAVNRFVWPMEKIKNGKRIRKIFPVKSEKLEEFGSEKIWVTPKVPFMVPLLLGFIISFIGGDILYFILSRIMG